MKSQIDVYLDIFVFNSIYTSFIFAIRKKFGQGEKKNGKKERYGCWNIVLFAVSGVFKFNDEMTGIINV